MAAERRIGGIAAVLSRGSVRLRTTLAATIVVALALLLGAAAFLGIIDRSLTSEVLASVRTRANDLGALLETGALPGSLVSEQAEDEFIQVIGQDGEILAASSGLGGAPPVVSASPGAWQTTPVPFDDERFLALVTAVEAAGDAHRLIVGRTLEPVAETTALVAMLLVAGLPLLLGLVAVTTWSVVGRALAPVERMRGEVESISGSDLHRRVPQPASDDEIARLARTMNRMLERLESSAIRQRQLVSDTSHELRSPIASLRQQAEVALAHPGRTTTVALANGVLADGLRLQRLVDDLLILARSDEGSLRLRVEPVDLDDLVFDSAAQLREGGRLDVDVSAVSAGRVAGDAMLLRRVINNLADNAARHADRRVAFALGEAADAVELLVDDDGAGIRPGDRTRVFERFVRLDEARARDDGGGGLGLAIVAEVVRGHEGSVTAGESPLGGARFTVRLPSAIDPID